MSKRTIYTKITPLPPQITREIVIDMLHDHDTMIELNPLVIEHHPIPAPQDAVPEEYAKCVWHAITDRVSYLPGGLVSGKVTYNASFYDLPYGIQTHIYAPLGLDIKAKWSVGGTLPGESRVREELGVKLPREGLYLREDVDLRCNILATSFVKKTMEKAHGVLVDRLVAKSEFVEDVIHAQRFSGSTKTTPGPSTYSSSASHTSVTPTMTQEEWQHRPSITTTVSADTSGVHELGQAASPAELYSDPGYNNPAINKYESQRKANPFSR